jgi:hypothetical protein
MAGNILLMQSTTLHYQLVSKDDTAKVMLIPMLMVNSPGVAL